MKKMIQIAGLLMLVTTPVFAEKAQALTFNYTTLQDQNGTTIQSWSGVGGYSAHLSDSGTVWYTGGGSMMGGACAGAAGWGNIYEKDWNGNTIRTITTAQLGGGSPHHAITITSKGTVLAIIGENYNGACGERIVEFDPKQNKVIWAWHTNDHQGTGAYKLQRGTNANDPYHMNNVDWDPTSNKIVFSAHSTYEIYVIDRSIDSTAAKGTAGDVKWRAGNPSKYGITGATQLASYAVHSARWVKPGTPGAGNIVFYANISPANGGYATGYELRPIYSLKTNGEWDYEIMFKGTNSSNRQSNTGGMDKLFNGNWLVTFSNESKAYEFDATIGTTQTKTSAVGNWTAPQMNGIRRYPLCFGAIAVGKAKGDAEATTHYNNYCATSSSSVALSSSSIAISSSVVVSSSSAIVSSSSFTPVAIKKHEVIELEVDVLAMNGTLQISGLSQNARVTITDARGVVKHHSISHAMPLSISTSSWSKGIYFIQVQGKNFNEYRSVNILGH